MAPPDPGDRQAGAESDADQHRCEDLGEGVDGVQDDQGDQPRPDDLDREPDESGDGRGLPPSGKRSEVGRGKLVVRGGPGHSRASPLEHHGHGQESRNEAAGGRAQRVDRVDRAHGAGRAIGIETVALDPLDDEGDGGAHERRGEEQEEGQRHELEPEPDSQADAQPGRTGSHGLGPRDQRDRHAREHGGADLYRRVGEERTGESTCVSAREERAAAEPRHEDAEHHRLRRDRDARHAGHAACPRHLVHQARPARERHGPEQADPLQAIESLAQEVRPPRLGSVSVP